MFTKYLLRFARGIDSLMLLVPYVYHCSMGGTCIDFIHCVLLSIVYCCCIYINKLCSQLNIDLYYKNNKKYISAEQSLI